MQTSGPQMLTFPEMTDSDENTIILLDATTNGPRRTRKNAGEERERNFFLQFDFCLFAGRCKKRKKRKTHRKRRVSVKRRKGTVHQKIESQSHVDGKSEEVSSSNTETQLGQVSGRSEIPISLTNDDVIYTKILILNSLCKKP